MIRLDCAGPDPAPGRNDYGPFGVGVFRILERGTALLRGRAGVPGATSAGRPFRCRRAIAPSARESCELYLGVAVGGGGAEPIVATSDSAIEYTFPSVVWKTIRPPEIRGASRSR